MKQHHLILWDGECGFCRRTVSWLLAHDRFGHLQARPNQEADIPDELRAACQSSVHVVKSDGKVLRGGRAVLFCGQQTRWHQLARIGMWPVFLPFIEIGYAFVAKHRHIFSRFLFTGEQES